MKEPAQQTADSVHEMQEFKALMQSQMGMDNYKTAMQPYQAILQEVMAHGQLLAIEACDVIVLQLDANSGLDEETRELQKALYMIVACDMMGQDFINSLLQ